MALTAADLKVRFSSDGADKTTGDINRLGKSVDAAAGKTRRFGGVIAGTAGGFIAANAVMAAASIGRDLFTGAITAASDLSETVAKSGEVFGGNADRMKAWSDGAADAFGLSQQEALATSATLGNLFKGVGIGTGVIDDMSKQTVAAAADLASFNNVGGGTEQVLADIQSGLVGESEPLRKYGILLNETVVAQKAMEQTGKANAKQLTEADKVAARHALIMEQLGDAEGDFARTQGGLANQQRILDAVQKDLAATIGRVLLPAKLALTRAAIALTRGFERAVPAILRFLRPLADIGRIIGSAFTGRFKGFSDAAARLPEPLRRAGHALGVVVEGFADLFAFVRRGEWDRFTQRLPGELRQIAGGLGALGDELGQGVRFVANIVIDSVVSLAGWLADHAGDIWGGIKSLAGWAADTFTQAITATIDGAIELAGDIADAAGDLWGWIAGKIMGGRAAGRAFSRGQIGAGVAPINVGAVLLTGALALADALLNAGTWFVGQVQDRIPATVDAGRVVVEATLRFAGDFGSFAGDVTDGALRAIRDADWSGVPAALFNLGQELGRAIPDVIVAAFNAAEDISPSDLLSFAGKVALGVAGAFLLLALSPVVITAAIGAVIAGAIKGAVDEITPDAWNGVVGKMAGSIADAITGFVGFAANIGRTILGEITQAASEVVGAIRTADFAGLAGKIAAAIGSAITAAADFATGIATAIKDKITSVEIDVSAADFAGAAASIGQALIDAVGNFIKDNWNPVDWFTGGGGGNDARGLFGDVNLTGGGGAEGLAGFFGRSKQEAPTFTATITADASQYVTVMAESLKAGQAFADLTFTPKLHADPAQFVSVVAASLRAGVAFGAQTFTAKIAGDASHLNNVLTGAYIAGHTWASQVFTATFSINTGPLLAAVEVARNVAQQIRDLMPSSPAKKGPLSKPISFAYIPAQLRRDLAPMAGIMAGGFGVPTLAMGAAVGRTTTTASAPIVRGGARHLTINMYGVNDPDRFGRELDRELALRGW